MQKSATITKLKLHLKKKLELPGEQYSINFISTAVPLVIFVTENVPTTEKRYLWMGLTNTLANVGPIS